MGTANPPTIINPVLTSHSVSSSLLELIFDSLVRLDGRGRIQPGLAEKWEVSADELEYTFYLRKNIKFHDGTELTSKDVKFTYDLILDPKNKSHWRSDLDVVKEVSIIDDFTVRFILKKPFSHFLHKAVREIVPKHIWEGQNLSNARFNYEPVGTGPFKFKEWNKENNTIILTANKNYFEDRPYLDQIQIKVYPDISRLWSAFMRREIHVAKFIHPRDFKLLEEDLVFKTYEVSWGMYYALVYDLDDPVFYDKDIRWALSYAINVKELIKNNSYGGGLPAAGPFHPDSDGYNSTIKPVPYEPQKALDILNTKGWYLNEEGILEKNGRLFTIKLLVNSRIEERERIATMIRQQFSQVGIQTTLVLYEPEKFPVTHGKDMPQVWLRFFRGIDELDGYDAIKSWYSSSTEPGKVWHYRNNRVDQLFEEVKSENNAEKRTLIYQELHKLIYDDQPATFLFFPISLHAVSADFENTDEYFSPHMPTYTIKDWYTSMN
ncbi:MAG: hypothetical protein KC684_03020 [Candidatus Omnitrophica bacterium]|nr:hypothetical protein [Candidatus Omnitrophota bacterium]